jgi:muconolactone delta-isomerase
VTADVFVGEDFDDAAMVRVYARENATQRGLSSTALTGTVASAVKYIAKAILTGSDEQLFSSFHLPTLRDRLLSEDGMGREIVLAFLHDIPGINDQSMKQQIANLKASGDYARLIAEVQQDIAALEAGIVTVDVFVGEDMDDAGMIRVYARENATQRGNTGSAAAGMVASTVRHLAKAMLTNSLDRILINLSEYDQDVDIAAVRGHFLGAYGMGRDIVFLFLKKVPGINKPLIQHQLALLKESGHYDRIIQEVKEEIDREHQAAIVYCVPLPRPAPDPDRSTWAILVRQAPQCDRAA